MREENGTIYETKKGSFYFVGDKDCVEEGYGSDLEKVLFSTGADLVFCGILFVSAGHFQRKALCEYIETMSAKEAMLYFAKNRGSINGLSGCLISKKAWEKAGMTKKKALQPDSLYDLLDCCSKVTFYPDCQYYTEKKGAQSGECIDYKSLKQKKEWMDRVLKSCSKEERDQLFNQKERLALAYPVPGRCFFDLSYLLAKKMPKFHKRITEWIDGIFIRHMTSGKEIRQMLKKPGEGRIIITGTPEYHNLGDHAIAYAQLLFARDFFGEKEIIQITERQLQYRLKTLKRYLRPDDLLLFQGGGNMGDEYIHTEKMRCQAIKMLAHFSMALMPQTIHFKKKENIILLKKAYEQNKKMILAAREATSYRRMTEIFPNHLVISCPDMVLYLTHCQKLMKADVKRSGILLILRSDAEGILSMEDLGYIRRLCREKSRSVRMSETSLSYQIEQEKREQELYKKWKEIGQAELVITDRLHGMLFCAIMGTPCIVMSNYNHKIRETYDWLGMQTYIHFIHSLEELPSALSKMEAFMGKTFHYDNSSLLPYYQQLSHLLKGGSV